MTPLELMLDELAIADVHAGFPTERRELARRLLHDGVSPDDVGLLAVHCQATVDGTAAAARVLVSILIDAGKRDARLVDLREIAARKAIRASQDARAPGDAKYVPGPTQGETQEAWEHDRMCRIAWCRVHGDHRSREEVARELGVSVTTIGTMLDRGRVLSASPIVPTSTVAPTSPAAAQREERATEQRVQEWRGRMRADGERARFQRGQAKGLPDWRRMDEAKASILAGVRQHGVVDLGAVMRDPTARGALAELEYAGAILRAGEPDAQQRQPYQAARNNEERKRFREQFMAWARADVDRPRQAVPHG